MKNCLILADDLSGDSAQRPLLVFVKAGSVIIWFIVGILRTDSLQNACRFLKKKITGSHE
jgi:hypothetical protein